MAKRKKRKKITKVKKKMKTVNKAFWAVITWVAIVQMYVMVMIVITRDTMTLAILAGTVFTEAFGAVISLINYKRDINLMHMEKNYIPNYDEERGLK